MAENISFGMDTELDVIFQLLIDDGVESRGHRKNMFNKDLKVVGVGIAKHK